MEQIHILPAGDRAMVADFGNVISEEVNQKVNLLQQKLAEKELPGVLELVPAFRSLLIEYDPAMLPMQKLRDILQHIPLEEQLQNTVAKHIWKIPCCYGGKYGEDLQNMAELTGLSPQEIINIHSSTDYRVYMLGFLPGFVYLGGLDPRIAVPRLSVPRVEIPAGSVAIGGSQTGVYPIASPGGWRLIGSTPLAFYDPEREKPILCEAGDFIRFVPITPEEYEQYDAEAEVRQ